MDKWINLGRVLPTVKWLDLPDAKGDPPVPVPLRLLVLPSRVGYGTFVA